MPASSNGNDIQFVMDGSQFFSLPDQMLLQVQNAAPAVGTAGHDVKVILWDPGLVEQWVEPEMGSGHHAAAEAFRTALDGQANGNISVYLERLNRYDRS
jgi:hypothetical protein